jgi:serralysin
VLGGGGVDRFLFQPSALGAALGNAATLQDFSRAVGEKINLSAIDAIAGTPADDAFTFIGTAAFTAAGQLRWEDQGGMRLIQGNVDGDTSADLTLFLQAAGPVATNWFVL